jgi:hypothetical protein
VSLYLGADPGRNNDLDQATPSRTGPNVSPSYRASAWSSLARFTAVVVIMVPLIDRFMKVP